MKSLISLLLLSILAFPQKTMVPNKKVATKGQVPVPNLNDSFVTTALKALDRVEQDRSIPEMRNGDIFVSRDLSEAISDVKATARSDEELEVAKALNEVMIGHLIHNLKRDTIAEGMKNADYALYRENPQQFGENVKHMPESKALDEADARCSSTFERVLRSRVWDAPKVQSACASSSK